MSIPHPNNFNYLCISVTMLQPLFHGRCGTGGAAMPEWPPSPLRVFQAILSAAAAKWGEQDRLVTAVSALKWLEKLEPPIVVAPSAAPTSSYVTSVPNNSMDLVAAAWARGNYSNENDANPATHRTMKSIQAMRMAGDAAEHRIHYFWQLDEPGGIGHAVECNIKTLIAATRCVVALGWGIDVAIGDGKLMSSVEAEPQFGEQWSPTVTGEQGGGGSRLRVPVVGTLDALMNRHARFLSRLSADRFNPPPPLSTFGVIEYRRANDLPSRPFAAFVLRPIDGNGEFVAFRIERAMHVAAMLRHAAWGAAKGDLDNSGFRTQEWAEQFIAGHGPRKRDGRFIDDGWPRFSYLPLPSIGSPHAGGMIRRAIIAEPIGGDGSSARWAAQRLHGLELIDEQTQKPVARLETIQPDEEDFGRVFHLYSSRSPTESSTVWSSVTPVILSGYDDGKPTKRAKILNECLRRAGLDVGNIASIESRPTSWNQAANSSLREFRLPKYLVHLPSCHVRLVLRAPFAGPLSIGAGRHCGLGVFAMEK